MNKKLSKAKRGGEPHIRFEVVVKLNLVQEDVWVLELLVETVLHLLYAADNTIQITVSGYAEGES